MTDTASIRLAACPFCGGEANIVRTMLPTPINESWGVSCNNTGLCQASIDCQATEAEAIAAWNRRAPSPSPAPGVVEALDIAKRIRENAGGTTAHIIAANDAHNFLERFASLSQPAKGEREGGEL